MSAVPKWHMSYSKVPISSTKVGGKAIQKFKRRFSDDASYSVGSWDEPMKRGDDFPIQGHHAAESGKRNN